VDAVISETIKAQCGIWHADTWGSCATQVGQAQAYILYIPVTRRGLYPLLV